MFTYRKTHNFNKGVSLYLAFMVMTVLLAMALGLGAILFGQLRIVRELGYSVTAFYAADTGMERTLFEEKAIDLPPGTSFSGYLDLNENGIADEGDSFYRVLVLDEGVEDCPVGSAFCIKSIGSFREVRRAILLRR